MPIATSATKQLQAGLLGGVDRPPRPAEQASDFLTAFRKLRDVVNQTSGQRHSKIRQHARRAVGRLSTRVLTSFNEYCGNAGELPRSSGKLAKTQLAYKRLQEKARQAESDGESTRASAIRKVLNDSARRATEDLRTLVGAYGLAEPSPTQASQRTPAATAQTLDWCLAHRQLLGIRDYYKHAGKTDDADRFKSAARRMDFQLRDRFKLLDKKERKNLLPIYGREPGHLSRPEQKYRIFENTVHRTETEGESLQAAKLRRSMDSLHENAAKELRSLTREYGPLEDLAARAGLTPLQAPASPGSTGTPATARVIGAPLQPLAPIPRQLPAAHADALPMNVGDRFGLDPEPAPGSVSVPPPAPRRPDTGAAALPTVAELLAEPPGPSSRVMPSPAPPPPTASPREVPWVQRQDIVERFRFDDALIDAGATLGSGCADILGFDATRKQRILDDLYRLNGSAREDPTAAAALDDVDWSGIVKLVRILDTPPSSP